jgi:hypothetical protein
MKRILSLILACIFIAPGAVGQPLHPERGELFVDTVVTIRTISTCITTL